MELLLHQWQRAGGLLYADRCTGSTPPPGRFPGSRRSWDEAYSLAGSP